jgi:hypothetical protein
MPKQVTSVQCVRKKLDVLQQNIDELQTYLSDGTKNPGYLKVLRGYQNREDADSYLRQTIENLKQSKTKMMGYKKPEKHKARGRKKHVYVNEPMSQYEKNAKMQKEMNERILAQLHENPSSKKDETEEKRDDDQYHKQMSASEFVNPEDTECGFLDEDNICTLQIQDFPINLIGKYPIIISHFSKSGFKGVHKTKRGWVTQVDINRYNMNSEPHVMLCGLFSDLSMAVFMFSFAMSNLRSTKHGTILDKLHHIAKIERLTFAGTA